MLPAGLLFRPLIADPRWPAFGTTVRHYFDDQRWTSVAAVALGDMLPIVRGRIGESLQLEAGLFSGVWGLFDMDTESGDLVSMDYVVGGFGSLRQGPWSGIARVLHRSTHLGDEEVINRGTNRVNFSYESADARVAYEPFEWLRVYGGGGISTRRAGELRALESRPGRRAPQLLDPAGASAADIRRGRPVARGA